MNRYLRPHNLLLLFIILAGIYAPLNAAQNSNKIKTDLYTTQDIFPVFCGRFIVLKSQVPKQLTENKKTYEIGFFEQEINRFQAYVLATNDHDEITQYKNKYLDQKFIIKDDKENNITTAIRQIILMGTFCPHFGTYNNWQEKLKQNDDRKAAEQQIAQEMWKKAQPGGVFIVGVTDADLKSNNVYAAFDKKTNVFKKKSVPFMEHDQIRTAFTKTPSNQSLIEFLKKEKRETVKEEKFKGIENQGKEYVFFFISIWLKEEEHSPHVSSVFSTEYCWELNENTLIPVMNLKVKSLQDKIFFNANNNRIPDFYSVEMLQYFYFSIDGRIEKSIFIPYYDCGM